MTLMSACSARNYNFRCINVFWRVLSESARTAAKSRTNPSINSGKAIGTKCGTHVQIHMGMDIRQTNCPSRHKWSLGGIRGSTIHKSGEAVRLAPTCVHVCGFIWEWTEAKYKSPLNTPGGFTRSQIQKYVETVKRLDQTNCHSRHKGGTCGV